MNSAQSAFGPHFLFSRRWLKKEQPIRSWLPHSSLEVPLGISLQSESDRREIKVEVQKSHFSVDAQEIVVSFNCPERDLRKYFHLAVSAEVSSEVSWRCFRRCPGRVF